jgi:hypothetical protein
MSATYGSAIPGSRPELITATYRRLRWLGFDDPEAANLTAVMNGFGIASQPWRVGELTHLLFLRELRLTGRRWWDADDRADGTDTTPVPSLADRSPRDDADPSDGRVTLLTLFRSMAGPAATNDLLRRSAHLRPDAGGGSKRERG